MFRQLRAAFDNFSIKTKTFLILLVVFLVLSIAFIFGLNWIDQVYSDQIYESVASRLTYSGDEITSKLRAVENVSQMILARDAVQQDLNILKTSSGYRERGTANDELRSLLIGYNDTFQNNNIDYINLYTGDFMSSSVSYSEHRVPTSFHDYVREKAREAEGAPVWVTDYVSFQGLFLGRQIREIKNLSLQPLGELVINVDLDEMMAQTTVFSNQGESYIYLLLSGDDVIYHSPELSQEEADHVQANLSGDYEILTIEGRRYFTVNRPLAFNDWVYVCLLSYDNVYNALLQARLRLIFTLILCAIAMLVIAFFVMDSTTRHFKLLADRMLALGESTDPLPPPPYDYSHRLDEVGILHQQFDQMILRLENLIQINYVNELVKKEAQLQALENQINPHFLYNTLESVNWRAKLLGATEISEMVQALASLLRVTLSKNNSVYSLGQELELVRNYMVIQHYRFEDRLQYTIDTPPQYLSLPIPKLLIQPLVENAIHYGLEDSIDECSIRIVVSRAGDMLRIQVFNTQSAFEPDILENLHRESAQVHGHGIALLNIEERLKLTYGDAGRLTLYNQDDQAVAEITIPLEGEPQC